MDIFESLENLNVSEECFDEIMGIVEEVINEVSPQWIQKHGYNNAVAAQKHANTELQKAEKQVAKTEKERRNAVEAGNNRDILHDNKEIARLNMVKRNGKNPIPQSHQNSDAQRAYNRLEDEKQFQKEDKKYHDSILKANKAFNKAYSARDKNKDAIKNEKIAKGAIKNEEIAKTNVEQADKRMEKLANSIDKRIDRLYRGKDYLGADKNKVHLTGNDEKGTYHERQNRGNLPAVGNIPHKTQTPRESLIDKIKYGVKRATGAIKTPEEKRAIQQKWAKTLKANKVSDKSGRTREVDTQRADKAKSFKEPKSEL